MVVKGNIFEFKFFLVAVLMNERCIEFALTFGPESLYLNLLGKVHSVGRKPFEYGFFGAPVNSQLLVSFVIVKIFDLVFIFSSKLMKLR